MNDDLRTFLIRSTADVDRLAAAARECREVGVSDDEIAAGLAAQLDEGQAITVAVCAVLELSRRPTAKVREPVARTAFRALGALIDRAVRWAFPLTSFELDQLTDDKAREGSK